MIVKIISNDHTKDVGDFFTTDHEKEFVPEENAAQIHSSFYPDRFEDLELLESNWRKTIDKIQEAPSKPFLIFLAAACKSSLVVDHKKFDWETWVDDTLVLTKEDIYGWDRMYHIGNERITKGISVWIHSRTFVRKMILREIDGIYNFRPEKNGTHLIFIPAAQILGVQLVLR